MLTNYFSMLFKWKIFNLNGEFLKILIKGCDLDGIFILTYFSMFSCANKKK